MGWGPENGVFKKRDFSACGFFGLACARNHSFGNIFRSFFLKIAKMVFRAVPGLRQFSALRCWGLRYYCACMRGKPQFRQHFILTLGDIRAHVSTRSGSDSFFCFFCLVILPSRVLWVLDFRRVHARETPVSATFYLLAFSHSCPRFCEKRFGQFFSLCLSCQFVAAASCGFWIFVACMRPKPQFWHQLVLNLISLRVPRAYAHQRIHAQGIIRLVFQEQSITRASMPKP